MEMTKSLEQVAGAFLRKNSRFYERVVAHALRLDGSGDDEKALRWISLAAEIAWAAHPGRLSDERLEAMAVRIGQRLDVPRSTHASTDRGPALGGGHDRHVLHVATTVFGTGGHTRLLENWVKIDDGSTHSLLLLDQGREPIRSVLAERIVASGGEMIVVPDGTPRLERARHLRRAAQSGYDLVILHHHPNDVVPLVAFANADGPPVAVMNHADHVFWLGVSIADLMIEYRDFGEALSRGRRGSRHSVMFPLPLDIQSTGPTRTDARARLGIADAERMLLTIGPAAKYMPTQRQRFFDTASKLLDRHRDARLYVIGVSEGDRTVLDIPAHPRMTLLGIMGDPADYEAAADLYLEGFPFGSYTALLETAARGTCPVVMHSPTAHNDATREATLHGLVASATDEQSYLAEIDALLADPEARMRRGRDVARRVEDYHGAAASRRYLEQVYRRLEGVRHAVEPLLEREAESRRHDLDLAGFQSSRRAIPVAEWVSTQTVLELSFKEWIKLLGMSVAAGDTQPVPRHAKAWMSMLKRRLERTMI